jgi:hypothetical protein
MIGLLSGDGFVVFVRYCIAIGGSANSMAAL